MKRKLVAGMMTVMLAASMVIPVAAATTPANQDKTLTLTATKGSAYTLTIPADTKDVAYGALSTELGSLKVTGNVGAGESVKVSATTTNQFVLTGGSASDTIAFTLMNNTDAAKPVAYADTTWNEADLSAATPKEIPLSVNIEKAAWDDAKAGSYTGSIVFTATFNEAAPK